MVKEEFLQSVVASAGKDATTLIVAAIHSDKPRVLDDAETCDGRKVVESNNNEKLHIENRHLGKFGFL